MESPVPVRVSSLNPTAPSTIVSFAVWNDPLAYLLIKLKLLGDYGWWQKWRWPIVFSFFYFGVSDCFLPLLLGRFSSKPGYLGPFDPLLLPYRIADAVIVPALAYYYGRATLLFSGQGFLLKDGTVFDQLRKNGIFGPPGEEVEKAHSIENEQHVFERWVGWMWLTPAAIALALWIAESSSFQYASPPRPHLFINSDSGILLFNIFMWLVNYYMIAVIIMRLFLLSAWLIRFYFKSPWRTLLNVDVLNPDDRMGFLPITKFVVFAAKMLFLALLFAVSVLRGNQNIGLPPAVWWYYLVIIGIFVIPVFSPLSLIHEMMQHQKNRLIDEITARMGSHVTSAVRKWPEPSDPSWENLLIEQTVLVRLGQVRDWPVTLQEVTTVLLTYLLGASLTIISALQGIVYLITGR